MKQVINLVAKFGHLIILFNLILLMIIVFLKRFGFAEKFGNFTLFLAIFIVTLQILKGKFERLILDKQSFFTNKQKFFQRPLLRQEQTCLFLGWAGIVFAAYLVYGSIFSNGPVVWGDAPYFYPEAFKNFFAEPLVWESRGRLGVVNDLYFIYPIMLVYHALGSLLRLSNDVIIRLVFYIPTILFAFLGPWQFSRYLGFSSLVGLFSSLVYLLNTYLILIIDGGQVGVALAYSLFPLTLLHLHKLITVKAISQFFKSLIFFLFITMADVRFAVIAFFTFIVWVGLEQIVFLKKINYQHLKIFVLFGISYLAVSAYWLVPLFAINPTTGSGLRSGLHLISILNPLFFFSPHWPFNEFGKISPPQWFFAGIPLLIFINLFFKKKWYTLALTLNFLFFVFLAKGDSGFLGGIYAWVVDRIPMGGAFRDSTKFFAPLILYAGILIGLSVENLRMLFKKPVISLSVSFLIFGYLIFLLYPALSGSMYGVLAKRDFPQDLKLITNKLSSESKISTESGFLRTVWFPERHPLSYHTEETPALDAKALVNLRPLASLNVGISDRFNFLHNKQSLEWLDIFGVRYLIFSGDTRRVLPNKEEEADWNKLLGLVNSIDGLRKVDLGTGLPVYKTDRNKPRLFAVDKVFAVVGGDDIYQKLIDLNNKFSIGNQGFVFFEDGKFNPITLQNVSSDSVVLIFNQKEKKDLILSFLSKFFQPPMSTTRSQWALRSADEYLKWKFELLVNGIKTSEFDYGKGIAFSSQPNEELTFSLNASRDGEYMLAVRHMSASESSPLRMSLADQEEEIPLSLPDRFSWYTEQIKLKAGRYDLSIKNPNGFQVVNVVALIPERDWESSDRLTQNLLSKFPTSSSVKELTSLSHWHEINYKMVSPIEYRLEVPEKMQWLVFTDSYHPQWNLKAGSTDLQVYSFYSAVNGFYIGQNGLKDGKLFFKEQEKLRVAVGLSLVSLAALAGLMLWIYYTNRKNF